MQFENQFDVDAPLDEVWKAVLDVERVAPTVPGAKVLERTGDDAYKVAIKVRVGPMSMTYRGDVEIVERDDTAHHAVMRARAKESRGQGTADANVTMDLAGDDGHTKATIVTDVDLSGKVAAMGQGVLQDVSGRLVETFAMNLARMLEGGDEQDVDAQMKPANIGAQQAKPGEVPAEMKPANIGAQQAKPGEVPAEMKPANSGLAAPPKHEDALDLGSVGGAMLTERLQDPRRLGAAVAIVALIAYVLGRRAGARR